MTGESDPLIGQLVAGRYRVHALLGSGGMGQVYLAEHEAIQKKVALKVLHVEFSKKEDIVTRFQQEAISASRIKHPNVLDIFDFGRLEDGSFFLAMEFLEGNDLADELGRRHSLEPGHALRIGLQICRALSAAHNQGVVHRDLKPENVFLQRMGDGEEIVKIVDFGIAQLRTNEEAERVESKHRRLTKTGMIFGTPEYMSPEQAAGKGVDHRADIYAVGVILYELCTGAVPFTGESFLEVLNKHLQEAPPPMSNLAPNIGLSQELQSAVHRALAKNPAERFQTMSEFANALSNTPEAGHLGQRVSSLPDTAPSPWGATAPGSPTAAQFALQGAASMHAVVPGHPSDQRSTEHHAPAPGTSQYGAVPGQGGPVVSAHTAHAASHTQLDATTAPLAKSSGAGLIAGVLGALVLLAGAAGAFFVLRPGSNADVPPASAAALSSTTPSSVRAEPEPPASVSVTPALPASTPSETEVAPATHVRLEVVTTPEGAVVYKDGFQVCDTTPCEVTATRDETLTLEAKKGVRRGKAKVLAQRDQTVNIQLAAPRRREPRLCEVIGESGLKVWRECP